jgi:hypothetical protein
MLAALTAACAEPPVKPIPEAARRSVTAASADISGVKHSDTSKIGARGSDEGGRLGAQQGAATVIGNSGGSLLGLILAPVGAAVGGAKGASEARSIEVVDETRANLRVALQETDFTELLKQRLSTSRSGVVEFTTVTSGSSSAPQVTSAGAPVGHVIALEYQLTIYGEYLVNPLIGVYVQVSAQVQSPDRKQMLHKATWSYCGARADFVQVGANNAASLRAQIGHAATVLGEAIPYDLYVSRQPRGLKLEKLGAVSTYMGCMDYSDLPSRTGQPPVVLDSPQPIPLAPAATASAPAPTAPAPTQAAAAASPVLSPNAFDGTWQVEMQLSTAVAGGGPCPARYAVPVTFVNGSAEWPRGALRVTDDGVISGWANIPPTARTINTYLVDLSGNMEGAVGKGSVSRFCPGTFVLRKP